VVLAQAGATDYSNEISAIRASGDFDGISLGIDGNDIAYFLKAVPDLRDRQAPSSLDGLLAPVAKIAGLSAYENVYLGGIDAFSVSSPNPWAQVFVRTTRRRSATDGVPRRERQATRRAGDYDACSPLWQLYGA